MRQCLYSLYRLSQLKINYSFLADEMTDNEVYELQLSQSLHADTTDAVLGTQTYIIIKEPREPIKAKAGSSRQLTQQEPTLLQAEDVEEDAVYNWYNTSGELVHTGRSFTVTLDSSETYTLEVIADLDGMKDYDQVELRVNPYSIQSLSPNPASNNVLVSYQSQGAQTAYLMLVQPFSNQSHNFVLDPEASQITLQTTQFQSGIYNLLLVCDGEVVDSETLQISH